MSDLRPVERLQSFIRWLADRLMTQEYWRYRALTTEVKFRWQSIALRNTIAWTVEVRNTCTCGAVNHSDKVVLDFPKDH